MLTGIRFPLDLAAVGFPPVAGFDGLVVWHGPAAWVWEGDAPSLPIEAVAAPPADRVEAVDGWGVDHIVVTTPELDTTVTALGLAGADLRRFGEARGRRAAFLLAGVLIEVVEVDTGRPFLWGLALETDEPLSEVADRWRIRGWDVSDPHDAVQPGRRIMVVRNTPLAVMSRRV
jgi:hypothetical protein